jgi:hypothetical protein
VINAYLKQIGVNVTVSTKLDPAKWAKAKAKAKAKMGGHSARAMQLATKYYKADGGRYKGPKKKSNKLSKWTNQKWKTKSGKPSSKTGERYLPEKAIKALSPKEYAATTKAKRAGTTQFVKQPKKIARKTRKYRTA